MPCFFLCFDMKNLLGHVHDFDQDPLVSWDRGVGFNRIGMDPTSNVVNFFETLQNDGTRGLECNNVCILNEE